MCRRWLRNWLRAATAWPAKAPVSVFYKGTEIARHRIDILVDNRIVVESKAGEHLAPAARLQLSNYLKATGLEVGLLLHFGPKPLF